ncbi:MAG: cbb3-type cytochrome c oxidase subunit I [Bacteroidetes bacterium]|nr:cbb3-type cytochrome c oxidase subunit I [Bacteroidota bacterium]
MSQSKGFISFMMNPKNWWIPLLIIFAVSFGGVGMIGYQTYNDAPPLENFISRDGAIVFSKNDIIEGKKVFHQYGLMDYGSMFGDGGIRGQDFTAEALHEISASMYEFYSASIGKEAAGEKLKKELKSNTHDESKKSITITDAGVKGYSDLVRHYQDEFYFNKKLAKGKTNWVYIPDTTSIRKLAAFFYWGAWVCAVERPGESYSYTHNWPYDTEAGNFPSHSVYLWSVLGLFGFILGLCVVLYYYSQFEQLNFQSYTNKALPLISFNSINNFKPSSSQKASFKFLIAGVLLFFIQVVCGILTVHDFVGIYNLFGIDFSTLFPFVVSRSWHVQLSVLWISSCWIGASLFVLPLISKIEIANQKLFVNILFWFTLIVVLAAFIGIYLGPTGFLGKGWYWFGHQGWEFLEMGRFYQYCLLAIFILWIFILYRGLKPAFIKGRPWRLPNWLIYTVFSVVCLFLSGFVAGQETNFVIADFWRWCVIHMWAEAFFEVFTTVIIGYFMVLMGIVSRQATERVIYIAAILFLGSGLLGISHNFYWNGKPVATMALGSIFSTLQVVPLILLTLEAWRFKKLPEFLQKNKPGAAFAMNDIFLFLVGVNFWNFMGAGVFGLIINLPIVNYFEHGTYLTVNHGHAALMGVYGNLSIAAVLFCAKLLFDSSRWNEAICKTVFWSINIGLALMVVLDLFPAGVYQLNAVFKNGLWYARSDQFLSSNMFQSLTWLRIIGGSVFFVLGVLPLCYFIMTRIKNIKKAALDFSNPANNELFSQDDD